MDFIRVAYKENKDGTRSFYPALQAVESQDLVIRGGQFVAIWDEDKGLFDRKQSHIATVIDKAFAKMVGEQLRPGDTIKKIREYDNQIYSRLMGMVRNIGDMGPDLDLKIVFADETPVKEDAATFKMTYSLSQAECPAWDEIVGTIYDGEERTKIEYAIGSIFTANSLNMQKFYVFYGPPGSGKSTILNIIELLFHGHTAAFSAYEMGRSDSAFALEPFKLNPLVGIDQDGDLSRIEMNTNLNKITAHDRVNINAKGKSLYEIYPRTCIFVGTNEPVKIKDKKSGIFRRLVDIQPTGKRVDENEYHKLMTAVKFELGAIAQHCINVFNQLGPLYLSEYRAMDMMYRTNDIFNFVEDSRLVLQQGITLKQAHKMYLEWCSETETRNIYKQYQFRDMLKDYFEAFHEQHMIDGVRYRSYFEGLRELEHFTWKGLNPKGPRSWLTLEPKPSLLDELLADMPAQKSTGNDAHPLRQAWDKVTTTLKDLDTSEEHYVRVPPAHIVVDFDLTDEYGNKSLEKNLEAAALWPPTYAEPSRSGQALHLHYEYDGDVERLAAHHDTGIEVKTLLGGGSLRRRHLSNNGLPVSRISSGLKFKEEKVHSATTMASEKGLRKQIVRGLTKDVHPYTKPSMDFIEKVLNDAVEQGLVFDVTDMFDDILGFAMSSNNQSQACIEIALRLPLKSQVDAEPEAPPEEAPIAYFDIEVFPNCNAVGYITEDGDEVVKMFNPTPQQAESLLLLYRLMGWNNRGYDNHILWAISLGWTPEAVYQLSQDIIVHNNRNAMFGKAYSATYGDLYDIIVDKKSLKMWQILLGLPHKEFNHPWDEPLPEEKVLEMLDYLENDVRSTKAVAHHKRGDIKAREILAELSGLQVINTNRQHTEQLVFGDVKEPALVYTDLREEFPGYEFDRFAPGKEKSTYKGHKVGEGGWVDSEEGYWENVGVLDVASMHPSSIIAMNTFGEYTPNFKRLLDIRLALKAKDIEAAMAVAPEIERFVTLPHEGYDIEGAKALSDALKIVINSVYGLTAASFPNRFRDERNIDNIVAKRGALFMVDLKEYVESLGAKVVHVKTDSVKIPNITQEIADKVVIFGQKYGYDFEWEATYDKFVLFNDAVYVAREDGMWSATGKQFQHPVVFKTMFSGEVIQPEDYVEVKQCAKGVFYLVTVESELREFVGKFGAFVPVVNGRQLVRIDGDKISAVSDTKGYLWELDELATDMTVDMTYFQEKVDEGIRAVEKYVPYSELIA